MSNYNPIFRSPITLPELQSSSSHLTLTDLTGAMVILIQGKAGERLQAQFGRVPQQPGEVVEVGEGLLACLTPTQFYLFGKSPAAKVPAAMRAVCQEVTDLGNISQMTTISRPTTAGRTALSIARTTGVSL